MYAWVNKLIDTSRKIQGIEVRSLRLNRTLVAADVAIGNGDNTNTAIFSTQLVHWWVSSETKWKRMENDFQFFSQWMEELWDLLRVMWYGFKGLVNVFLLCHPGCPPSFPLGNVHSITTTRLNSDLIACWSRLWTSWHTPVTEVTVLILTFCMQIWDAAFMSACSTPLPFIESLLLRKELLIESPIDAHLNFKRPTHLKWTPENRKHFLSPLAWCSHSGPDSSLGRQNPEKLFCGVYDGVGSSSESQPFTVWGFPQPAALMKHDSC